MRCLRIIALLPILAVLAVPPARASRCLGDVLASIVSDEEWLTRPFGPDLQKINFPPKFYDSITSRMRAQVDQWIDAAAGNPGFQAALKTHRTHLQNLESDLLRFKPLLEAEGESFERLIAQVWVHDIGKFIPADPLVAARHANNPEAKFAEFMDHSKTSQQYIRRYPFFASNGRMDNVSRQLYHDIGGHDGPAGMILDPHAAPGTVPSVLHSWWGDHYPITERLHPNQAKYPGRKVGGNYEDAQSPFLQAVDRLDQPALFIHGNELIGGPNKIARQQRGTLSGKSVVTKLEALKKQGKTLPIATGQPRLTPHSYFAESLTTMQVEQESVWEALLSVPEGAYTQYLILQRKPAAMNSKAIQAMLAELKQRIDRVRDLKRHTRFFESSRIIPPENLAFRPPDAPPGSIGYVSVGGRNHYFSDVEGFFGKPDQRGAAVEWARQAGVPTQ